MVDLRLIVKELLEKGYDFIYLTITLAVVVSFGIFKEKIVSFLKTTIWNKIKSLFVHRKLRESTKFLQDAYDQLVGLRSEMHADRAWIIEFSNGDKFTSKNPIWRISRTYSSVGLGIAPEKNPIIGLPVTLFWDALQCLFGTNKNNIPGITTLNDYKICGVDCKHSDRNYLIDVDKLDNSYYKDLCISNGTKFIIMTPILNSLGYEIGIIGVEYLTENFTEIVGKIAGFTTCNMCMASSNISSIFSTYHKY